MKKIVELENFELGLSSETNTEMHTKTDYDEGLKTTRNVLLYEERDRIDDIRISHNRRLSEPGLGLKAKTASTPIISFNNKTPKQFDWKTKGTTSFKQNYKFSGVKNNGKSLIIFILTKFYLIVQIKEPLQTMNLGTNVITLP